MTPVYRQLAASLHEKIQSGEYPPGRAMPSENRLMQDYGLAREMVRKAIGVLADEGLVQAVHGRGVFVVERS